MSFITDKIKLSQAIVVEGRYDKIKLESVIDGVIIVTNGFGIYKDKEKLELIRAYAHKDGVIILTDSDNAGRQIRNYLKQTVGGNIRHIYIPEILGKEKRKEKPSRSGLLGVEGIDKKFLEKLVAEKSQTILKKTGPVFNREMLFDDGLIGAKDSKQKRKKLLKELALPQNLSATALLEALNSLYELDDYKKAVLLIDSINYYLE
ncbi:MAG: DUF4093 domain-containing protein [Eubacterium sp.]|jgi:ribonuclease M5|nr:DUF4093 domain-containing protein [Eubacterium sp.]